MTFKKISLFYFYFRKLSTRLFVCVLLVWVHELVYWLGSVSRIRVCTDHLDLFLFGIISQLSSCFLFCDNVYLLLMFSSNYFLLEFTIALLQEFHAA